MLYLYLAAGGVLGTLARYALGGWMQGWAGSGFPWGTLVVNLLGSLLLGFLFRAAELGPLSPELRGFVGVGFCGAFTTFSTYSVETLALLQQGAWGRAAGYSLGSVAVGLAAAAAGVALASRLLAPAG